jgi:hypothetical protein
MLAIKGFYNGERIIPLEKLSIKQNQKVIITILDEYIQHDSTQKPHRKYMGMLDDKSCDEILQAVEDCEKVDANEW